MPLVSLANVNWLRQRSGTSIIAGGGFRQPPTLKPIPLGTPASVVPAAVNPRTPHIDANRPRPQGELAGPIHSMTHPKVYLTTAANRPILGLRQYELTRAAATKGGRIAETGSRSDRCHCGWRMTTGLKSLLLAPLADALIRRNGRGATRLRPGCLQAAWHHHLITGKQGCRARRTRRSEGHTGGLGRSQLWR